MTQFKPGQKIIMKEDCYDGSAEKGKIYEVKSYSDGGLYINSPHSCNCPWLWELVEDIVKTFDDLKVDDYVYTKEGYKRKILYIREEKGKKIFLLTWSNTEWETAGWYTIKMMKESNFTPTSPVKKMTVKEVCDALGYNIEIIG